MPGLLKLGIACSRNAEVQGSLTQVSQGQRAGLCWLPGGTRMSQQGPKLLHASRICAENQGRRRTLRKAKG